LGGTSKAYTVAQVTDNGDGSFVIEYSVNTACRCPTPYQPLFHSNQLNSCRFVHLLLERQNSDDFLGMAKLHHALVQDRPRFKGAYSKMLSTITGPVPCSSHATSQNLVPIWLPH
jgi:hypothetical protein